MGVTIPSDEEHFDVLSWELIRVTLAQMHFNVDIQISINNWIFLFEALNMDPLCKDFCYVCLFQKMVGMSSNLAWRLYEMLIKVL